MTPPKGSMTACLFGEEVVQALLNQGATIEQLRQLKKRDDIALALATELEARLSQPPGVILPAREQPHATALTHLADSPLTRREYNALLRAGFELVGDLTIISKFELLAERGIGHKAVQHIEDVLASDGLRLRTHRDDPFTHAVRVYGTADDVPPRLMWLWVPQVRTYIPISYLRLTHTARQLAQYTKEGYAEAFNRFYGSKNDLRDSQGLHFLEKGLNRVGLAFSE